MIDTVAAQTTLTLMLPIVYVSSLVAASIIHKENSEIAEIHELMTLRHVAIIQLITILSALAFWPFMTPTQLIIKIITLRLLLMFIVYHATPDTNIKKPYLSIITQEFLNNQWPILLSLLCICISFTTTTFR